MKINLIIATLLLFFLNACGVSKFSSEVGTPENSSENALISERNSEDTIEQSEEAIETPIDEQESEEVLVTDEDIAKLFVSGSAWNHAWNTDEYEDGLCLILVNGLAVVVEDCESQKAVICETACQANATDPAQCQQDRFKFYGTKDEMNYVNASAYCKSLNLVLFKYNAQKVDQFLSDLESDTKE